MNKVKLLMLFIVAFSLVSCGDDEDYKSNPPKFADITFRALSGSSELKAGEPFVATAEQSQKGTWLITTDYSWETAPAEGVTHKYVPSLNYGLNSSNPSDTLVVSTPGVYTLTFHAYYRTAGQRGLSETLQESLPDYGTVKYEVFGAAVFHYEVTATKRFTVK